MNKILEYKFVVLGIVIGAAAGYAYYHFIGCSSGTCPITSNPIISTVYGALIGAILFNNKKEK